MAQNGNGEDGFDFIASLTTHLRALQAQLQLLRKDANGVEQTLKFEMACMPTKPGRLDRGRVLAELQGMEYYRYTTTMTTQQEREVVREMGKLSKLISEIDTYINYQSRLEALEANRVHLLDVIRKKEAIITGKCCGTLLKKRDMI